MSTSPKSVRFDDDYMWVHLVDGRVIAAPIEALYPPTAPAAPRPLPLLRFLARFVGNPLRALPVQAYHEAIIARRTRITSSAWVMDPALIERILLHEADRFPKSPIERRVPAWRATM